MAQSNTTGEQANQGAREIIRARARDLERNSDVMNSLLLAFERNVIGSGIVPLRTAFRLRRGLFRLCLPAVDGAQPIDVRRTGRVDLAVQVVVVPARSGWIPTSTKT